MSDRVDPPNGKAAARRQSLSDKAIVVVGVADIHFETLADNIEALQDNDYMSLIANYRGMPCAQTGPARD